MLEEFKDTELLYKVVKLAKRGRKGEKENAIRIVKSLCKKLDLNFVTQAVFMPLEDLGQDIFRLKRMN